MNITKSTWIKTISVCLFIFLLIGAVYCFSQETEEQTKGKILVEKMYNSSVSIFSTGEVGTAICSGVVLKNDSTGTQVLTAKHCTNTFSEVYVDGVKVNYVIESIDSDLALFILSSNLYDKVGITLAEFTPYFSEIVYHMGFPKLDPYVSVGDIFLNGSHDSYVKMEIVKGCSGGGIFNEKGELIGILYASVSIGNGLAVYEPLGEIKRFLKTIKK